MIRDVVDTVHAAHLSRDDGRGDGPVVGEVRVHDGPEQAVALQAQVAGLRVRLAVAKEGAELQLQVHARDLAIGRLPLDGRAAQTLRLLRMSLRTQYMDGAQAQANSRLWVGHLDPT